MNFQEGKSGYPLGKLHGLEATKETLPAIEVKNKVLWVNPDLEIPFKLKVGEPTDLGMFLTHFSVAMEDSVEVKKKLETGKHHGRSAVLGKVIFGEKLQEGKSRQVFRDVDIKGVGHVSYEGYSDTPYGDLKPYVAKIRLKSNSRPSLGSLGIMDLQDAQKDAAIAETFHELGIRTCRTIAIVELEEVVQDGLKFSIAKAKEKGILADSAQPVLEIRAFGTHGRFLDVTGRNSDTKKNLLIEDARLIVAQELGEDPAQFDLFKYAMWLAKTIGKNVGLMHKNGYIHRYLDLGHNITLDGCLVDFDSVEHTNNKVDARFFSDYGGAEEALKELIIKIGKFNESQRLKIYEECHTSYIKSKESIH